MTFTHIACPVDFSEYSRHSLAHAAALARWYGARLSLLHVWTAAPPPMPYGEAPALLAMVPEQRTRIAEALNDLADPLRESGLGVSTSIGEGPAVPEILDFVTSSNADLLVMGTHGRGGFQHLVLGSVTEKVLRKASCPVLTVPKRVDAAHADHVHYKRILCPLDLPESSNAALRYALSLARESDAEITLLHVVEPIQTPPTLTDFDTPQFMQRLEADWRTRMRSAVDAETRSWCRLEEYVTVGRPGEVIVRTANELGSEIIVMGVQRRGALDLMMFGSTAHRVVREAPCPVMTIRANA